MTLTDHTAEDRTSRLDALGATGALLLLSSVAVVGIVASYGSIVSAIHLLLPPH